MNSTSNRELLYEWNHTLSSALIPDSVLLGIYMIVGLIGNASVIYIHKFRLKKITDDRYFISYLAMVDLLSCVFNSAFSISINSLPVRYENGGACKTMWFLCMTFTAASALMLVAIAIHRYLKICRPFGPQMMLTQKRMAIAVVGIVSVLISWPCFIFYGPKPVIQSGKMNITGYRCTSIRGPWTATEPLVFKTSILVLLVLCLVVLIVSYSLIGRVVQRQIRYRKRCKSVPGFSSTSDTEISKNTPKSKDDHQEPSQLKTIERGTAMFSRDSSKDLDDMKEEKKEHNRTKELRKEPRIRFTIVFMLITFIFVVSYVPKLAMMVYESRKEHFWTELSPHELGGYRFLYTVFIINNVVNPFIYGYFDKQFRDEFIKTFLKCNRL